MMEYVEYVFIGFFIMLGCVSIGSSVGIGFISSKLLEGLARQPELKPLLLKNCYVMTTIIVMIQIVVIAIGFWLFLTAF